jgi:ATP-binding cassette, subfamily B, multidrug efflux pump
MADSFHEEEILGKAYDGRLMRRLLRYLQPYAGVVVFALVATFLFGLLQVIPPYLMKVEVDRYLAPAGAGQVPSFLARWLSPDPFTGILQIVLIIFLPAVVGTFIMQFAQSFAMQVVGQRIMYDLRRQIFAHLQRLQLTFYDRNPVGRMVTRLTTDVDVLNDLFASGVVAIFGDVFSLLAIVVVMLAINWKLALLTFAVLPLIVGVTMMFRRAVRESYRRIRVAIARINAYLQEHLTGMAVLQLFGRETRSYEEFEMINRTHMKAYKDSILAYGLFYPAVELLGSLAVIVILYEGGLLHLSGAVTIGTLTAFIQYSQRFFRPIQDLSDKYNTLQSAMASSERIFKLLDTPVMIEDSARPKLLSGATAQGRIEFRDVTFAYDGKHRVVEHISFTIEPGEKVAMVGHTGAGKTTLTSLLLRFYDVTEGQILFDGVDIREMRLQDLRRNFGMVLQDPFLFSGTIASNIRLGTERVTDSQLRAAAEHVNFLDFIESLPEGFQEEVKERGSTLSVGQKQLLSFARALAHDPKVLILDEATSSVDPETEVIIRQGLERLMEGRTALIVAHRLSTIQNASKIVVMHKGHVREIGTHRELLERQGLYYKLYQLQYKDQELMASRERLAAVGTAPPGALDPAERDARPGTPSD